MTNLHDSLIEALDRHEKLTVAVSGGVDSMMLAYFAHRFSRGQVNMAHAVSPAVPISALERLKSFAGQHGWSLTLIDAGELSNPDYRNNPVNRCYFCKHSLYTRIRSLFDGPIASGTNLDDLGDYRPGLQAAAESNVVHPFVEAGIDKAGIRALARQYGLEEISELPSQPCLASRVETGIAIDPRDLAFIDHVERDLGMALAQFDRASAQPGDPDLALRCRITHQGVVIEASTLDNLQRELLIRTAHAACANTGRTFLGLKPYRRGSAFLTAGRIGQ